MLSDNVTKLSARKFQARNPDTVIAGTRYPGTRVLVQRCKWRIPNGCVRALLRPSGNLTTVQLVCLNLKVPGYLGTPLYPGYPVSGVALAVHLRSPPCIPGYPGRFLPSTRSSVVNDSTTTEIQVVTVGSDDLEIGRLSWAGVHLVRES
eukprot:1963741-Rhodomonas_salina.1